MKLITHLLFIPILFCWNSLFAQSAVASHALDSIYLEELHPQIHQEQDELTANVIEIPKHSKLKLALLKTQYWTGSIIHYSSWAMSAGGMLLLISQGNYHDYNIQALGAITLLGSIPVNGIGTSLMASAVNQMAEDTVINHKQGWYLYGGSILCLAIGVLPFIGGREDSEYYYSDSEDEENELGGILAAGFIFVIGALAHVVSWFNFNDIARDAQEEYSIYSVSISPTLLPTNTGNIAPGLAFTLQF